MIEDTPPKPETARRADAVDREVGRRIAGRRAALGRSQASLAAEVGVSFQQLQKYEAGLNRVSASRLHRIALALGAPMAGFFPDPDAQTTTDEASPASSEALGLLAAFDRIEARPVRRALIRIVRALAP